MIPPGWSHKVYIIHRYRIKYKLLSKPIKSLWALIIPFQLLLISHQSCLWSRIRKGLHQCLNISCTFTFQSPFGLSFNFYLVKRVFFKIQLTWYLPFTDLSHAILTTPSYEVPENSVSTSKKYIKLFIRFSHIYCLVNQAATSVGKSQILFFSIIPWLSYLSSYFPNYPR